MCLSENFCPRFPLIPETFDPKSCFECRKNNGNISFCHKVTKGIIATTY